MLINEFFYVCPSTINPETAEPQLFESLKIKNNRASIKILNAREIAENDFIALSGILPDDNHIIPKDI